MPSAKWFVLTLGLLGAAAGPAAAQSDCYFAEVGNTLVVGNSRVEVRLDRTNGVITGLLNRGTGAELVGQGGPFEVFRLVYSTEWFHGSPAGDPWSATEGTLVKGALQKVTATRLEKTPGGIRLQVSYDRLRLERRTLDVSVHYTVELRNRDEETRWRLALENRDLGTVKETHFPLVSGLKELDALIMPNESGQRVRDPVNGLSDDVPVMSLEYPGRGSMQWFEYGSPTAGLYMASYDETLAYTRMCFGRTGDGPEASIWVVKYPFAPSGASWASPELALGIHSGDWHWGADRYRAWFESWARSPDVPLKVQEMIGGLREIMIKGPSGEVSHTYESMVTLARQVREAPHGVAFMVAGWMYDGHDTYFPDYVPIPELGGREALAAALDGVHEQGVATTAYVNGRIANVETDTYKAHGKGWSVLGRAPGLGVNSTDFFELHEEWNTAWGERPGKGWFAVMCPSAQGWRDHLVGEVSRVVGEYGFDGVFLDQPGSYYGELCYNRHHGHDTPASAWGPGLLEVFRRVRDETRRLDPDSILWTEGMNDAFGQYMDYGMDKNPLWRPMRIHPDCESFVEMWRYTLPDRIIANDSGAYSFGPSHDRVYGDSYLFVLGVRGLSRSGERGIEEAVVEDDEEGARRRAVVEKIERLWIEGGRYLFHGRFMDDVGLEVSAPEVLAKLYRGEGGAAVPVWNTTSRPVTFDVRLDLDAVGIQGLGPLQALSLDAGTPLSPETSGGAVEVRMTLPPHEIDVLVLEPGT